MSKTAKTIYAFAFYLLPLGIALILVPNFMLNLFMFPPTNEVWIRILGMLLVWLAVIYFVIAKHELKPLFIWMVRNRIGTFLFFVAFVVVGWAPINLIMFGVVDLIAAVWTWLTMKKEFPAK